MTYRFGVSAIVVGLIFSAGCAGPQMTAGSEATAVMNIPPTDTRTDLYVSNRPPLLPNPLIKLPIGSIAPKGWLRSQLEFERDGMSGRLAEISPWCKAEGSAWMSPDGEGQFGWEELPYWIKGFGDLGYVLKDERIILEARAWIEAVLASQEADGYFGPRAGKTAMEGKPDLWPNMPMLNALQSFHEATGDPRVIPFMRNYFRYQLNLPREDLFPRSWQKIRAGDNLESVYWLYNRTGEAWLLDLARVIHERTTRWDLGVDVDHFCLHGVNFCQGFREPGEYYVLSGNRAHLDATERNYLHVMSLWGQVPGGMIGADENCRLSQHSPRQGAETCAIVEMMHSHEMLMKFTGDPIWADRCEEVAFNSFPASMTPDLKGLHYITSPNAIRLDRQNKAPGLQNSGCMLAYSADARYRCCQHNVAMGWPYYAEHLWTATQDRGLAAVLYAACDVRARVAGGDEVTITEATDYPFDETIMLRISAAGPVHFPLYLRVPRWCDGMKVAINGRPIAVRPRPLTYLRMLRTWKDGDRVRIEMPMRISLTVWRSNGDSVSVNRGPLTYSLRIGEQWVRCGGSDAWPDCEVFPTTPWNYGLVLDEADPTASFELFRKPGPLPKQPFESNSAPIELRAKGRRIPGWQADHLNLVGLLQRSPARTEEPVETITLIPMGCARLRISAFPVASDRRDAHVWSPQPPPQHEASFICDDITAVSDGRAPKDSNDQSVPRFTWFPHTGSKEWITWRFDSPRRVSACELYWFDDAGTNLCRAPESWRLLYRDGETWKAVKGVSAYGTEKDKFNRVTFEAITTTELRIEVKLREGFSGGILEWRCSE